MAVLGIDTSNYRTSLALADRDGTALADVRRLLTVRPGERGLRQSEALFQHIKNLPDLAKELSQQCDKPIEAICVSASPRPQADSYMPVFLAGVSHAQMMGALCRVPVFTSTHQEGHLMAAIQGLGPSDRKALSGDFLALHVSGGTTEVLLVRRKVGQMEITLLGGTQDLHAGQLVDRVGVAVGLSFPAGPEMEALALHASTDAVPIKSAVKGIDCNFSGAEAEAMRRIASGTEKADIAAAVLDVVARTLGKLIENAAAQTGLRHCLVTGGVAANARIQGRLRRRLPRGMGLYFGPGHLCGDNAVGIAFLGLEQWQKQMLQVF